MTGGGGAPLTQLLQFVHSEVTGHCELCVQHGRHVTGIQEETVATFPQRILGVVVQVLAIKYRNEICTAHSTSGMSALGFLYHCCR